MFYHRLYIILLLSTLVILVFACCRFPRENSSLVGYLQAERALRENIIAEPDLIDSLKILQEHYSINIDEEISYLNENPEEWIYLFKRLQREE